MSQRSQTAGHLTKNSFDHTFKVSWLNAIPFSHGCLVEGFPVASPRSAAQVIGGMDLIIDRRINRRANPLLCG
jgi:hypothetical protein